MRFQFIARSNRACAISVAAALALFLQMPDAISAPCSDADQQIRSRYQAASSDALKAGNLDRFRMLEQSLPGELSAACRRALEQMEPMRARCTADEKVAVLRHYQAIMQAAWSGDVMSIFSYMENLEQVLSPQCWLATNRHIDPNVQRACTPAELDHLASFAGPVVRATARLISSGDFAPLIEIQQAALTPLSQNCGNALVQLQQSKNNRPNQASRYQPENVIDHGGGTYSVPGSGACTPSGCMVY